MYAALLIYVPNLHYKHRVKTNRIYYLRHKILSSTKMTLFCGFFFFFKVKYDLCYLGHFLVFLDENYKDNNIIKFQE